MCRASRPCTSRRCDNRHRAASAETTGSPVPLGSLQDRAQAGAEKSTDRKYRASAWRTRRRGDERVLEQHTVVCDAIEHRCLDDRICTSPFFNLAYALAYLPQSSANARIIYSVYCCLKSPLMGLTMTRRRKTKIPFMSKIKAKIKFSLILKEKSKLSKKQIQIQEFF